MIKAHLSRLYHEHERVKIFLLLGTIAVAIILISRNIFLDAYYLNQPLKMGVTFSPNYAAALGLDPKKVYGEILQDLQVKYIRLPAYWNEIETSEGNFNFADLDYYINEAPKNNVRVILAIGYKLPRWPECRIPAWVNMDNGKVLQSKLLPMLETVIKRYDANPTIVAWQVENEPLLSFGICPPVDRKFLVKEVNFVKSRTDKPVVITDSGELRAWIAPMGMADYFGTTLYRNVYNDLLGNFYYPLKPWFYRVKAAIVKNIFARNVKKIMITELQTEPWEKDFVTTVPIGKQVKDFSLDDFKNNISFAKKVGFSEIYLWGVEWWYYMKTQNHPEYWNYAKTLF